MYGVLSQWNELSVVWYDTYDKASENAYTGDIIVVKIKEA